MNWQPSEARFPVSKLVFAGFAIATALGLAACHQTSHKPSEAAAARQRPLPPPFTAQDNAMALATLKQAPDHGFPAQRFRADEIEALLASNHDEGERRLRAAVLDYARAQHGLSIPIGALPRPWNQRRSDFSAEVELNAAVRAGTLQAWLDGLAPQTPDYKALQAAYLEARNSPPPRTGPWIEAGPLAIDQQDAGTEALRKRLVLEDPALTDTDPETPVDQPLIDALKAYQGHHGLPQTGVLDDATAARLDSRLMSKADKLRVNMERLRWLPRPEPVTRIDVNIASAQMTYFRDGQLAAHMLAVSGKIGDETPIVNSAIDSIVLDPPWFVPNDIAQREIVPKGPAYMQSRNFVWRSGRLIQKPGPKTALGLVKFDFPNPYAVYLHDTPSKASFSLAQRTASHGCVRLQHAVELARIVAGDQPGLSADQVDKIISSGKTVRIKLARPVPVRLMYFTAEPKGDEIAYLPDVYGWDPKLLALIDHYQGPRRKSSKAASPPAGGPAPSGSAPSASRTG